MATFSENFRESFKKGLPIILAGGAETGPNIRQMETTGEYTSQGKMTQGPFKERYMGGYKAITNPITFRDAGENEEVGMQKLRLLRKNGKEEDVFLLVPKQDSNTYIDWAKGTGKAGAVNDNSMQLNRDTRSVGLGATNGSEGQILGMIDASGRSLTASRAKDFLSKIGDEYVGVIDYETPTTESKVSGYIPGSALLNFFGLTHPQVRSNVSSFETPENHAGYNRFLRNLRGTKNG